MDFAVPTHFPFQPFRQKVDDRRAHAVKATAGGVGGAVLMIELSPGPERREYDLDGRDFLSRMYADRDASAVVLNADAAVFVDGDENALGKTSERFIDRGIDD